MSAAIRLLGADDLELLGAVVDGVFDHPIDSRLAETFLADPRHHLAVAIDDDQVIGMVTGFHYLHPDKLPELFINEIGVAPGYRGRGVAHQLLNALLEHGRGLGCREAWVLAEPGNRVARTLYGGLEGARASTAVMFSISLDSSTTSPATEDR